MMKITYKRIDFLVDSFSILTLILNHLVNVWKQDD